MEYKGSEPSPNRMTDATPHNRDNHNRDIHNRIAEAVGR